MEQRTLSVICLVEKMNDSWHSLVGRIAVSWCGRARLAEQTRCYSNAGACSLESPLILHTKGPTDLLITYASDNTKSY